MTMTSVMSPYLVKYSLRLSETIKIGDCTICMIGNVEGESWLRCVNPAEGGLLYGLPQDSNSSYIISASSEESGTSCARESRKSG